MTGEKDIMNINRQSFSGNNNNTGNWGNNNNVGNNANSGFSSGIGISGKGGRGGFGSLWQTLAKFGIDGQGSQSVQGQGTKMYFICWTQRELLLGKASIEKMFNFGHCPKF